VLHFAHCGLTHTAQKDSGQIRASDSRAVTCLASAELPGDTLLGGLTGRCGVDQEGLSLKRCKGRFHL